MRLAAASRRIVGPLHQRRVVNVTAPGHLAAGWFPDCRCDSVLAALPASRDALDGDLFIQIKKRHNRHFAAHFRQQIVERFRLGAGAGKPSKIAPLSRIGFAQPILHHAVVTSSGTRSPRCMMAWTSRASGRVLIFHIPEQVARTDSRNIERLRQLIACVPLPDP